MKKKIKLILKLEILAGCADPKDTKLARKLGQTGINISAFCREYNSKTEKDVDIKKRLDLIVYQDKSYSIILKEGSTSFFLLKYANIKIGSLDPKLKIVGCINELDLQEIINKKKEGLNTNNNEKIIKILMGTAKNMGITFIE